MGGSSIIPRLFLGACVDHTGNDEIRCALELVGDAHTVLLRIDCTIVIVFVRVLNLAQTSIP